METTEACSVAVDTVTTRQRAERLRRDALEAEKRNAKYNVEMYARSIAREVERETKADSETAKQAADWAECVDKLALAGFTPEEKWRFNLRLDVEQNQLKLVYKAIGRLDAANMEKDIADAEKGTIRITMKSIKYPFLEVRFTRKLTDKDKCKIESTEVPAHTEHRLVCGRE